MPKRTPKTPAVTLFHLQKALAIFGIGLLILAIVATLFTFINTSGPYIHDVLDISYYARFAITIGLGFAVGILFGYLSQNKLPKKKRSKTSLLFTGVTFGLLTYSLNILLDLIRLPLRDLFGEPDYPWGKLIFEGIPVAALILVILVALIMFYRKAIISGSSRWLQWFVIVTFLLQQIGMIISVGLLSTDAVINVTTILIAFLGFITTPLAIAIIAYFALRNVSEKLTRLFSASIIALICEAILYISWEFRTNPEQQATLIFSTVATIITYSIAAAMIIISRHIVHEKN